MRPGLGIRSKRGPPKLRDEETEKIAKAKNFVPEDHYHLTEKVCMLRDCHLSNLSLLYLSSAKIAPENLLR